MRLSLAFVLSYFLIVSARAQVYNGNLNTSFGGPIGLGTLSLMDNGTTISGTLTKGPNGFNDSLVIFIDSTAGGFADTSGFADGADGLRKAISGFDGGANRSVLTFGTATFRPDYAIALGPANDNFGGLWGLAAGGANSLNFISSVNLNPTGNNNSATYTFSFNLSDIGLTPGSGASFTMLGTYISDSGYRSGEALPGDVAGTAGWNPFLETQAGTYTTTQTPEPSSLALMGLGTVAAVLWGRRRK